MNIYFTETKNLVGNRWDPNYWRMDLIILINQLNRFKIPMHPIEEVSVVGIGQTGKRTFISNEGIQYLVIGNLMSTGVNYNKKVRFVEEHGFNDPKRCRVENEDILLAISGSGSIERSTIVLGAERNLTISQDVARIRLESDYPKYSTTLFLQSKWGVAQILRHENGTGLTHLKQEDIKKFIIPRCPTILEQWSKEKCLEINKLHNDFLISPSKENREKAETLRKKVVLEFEKKIQLYIK